MREHTIFKPGPRDYLFPTVTAAVFFVVLLFVYIFHLNISLFYFINSVSHLTGPWIWSNFTLLGDALLAALLFLPLIRKRPDLVWALIVSALIGLLIVHTLKPCLNIDRPARVLDRETFTIIGRVLKHKAFPSGHTATIFAVMGIFIIGFRKRTLRILFFIVAVLVGLSRIVVGAHWPLDVCGGAAAGLISATVGCRIAYQFPIGHQRLFQWILGGIFLIAAFVLLISYNTHYPSAIWFQRLFAVVVILWGGWEYWKCYDIKRNGEWVKGD